MQQNKKEVEMLHTTHCPNTFVRRAKILCFMLGCVILRCIASHKLVFFALIAMTLKKSMHAWMLYEFTHTWMFLKFAF